MAASAATASLIARSSSDATSSLVYLRAPFDEVTESIESTDFNGALGALHATAAKVLFALILLHSAGALANHYWFKTDVLRKMLPGQGRAESPPPGMDTRTSGE